MCDLLTTVYAHSRKAFQQVVHGGDMSFAAQTTRSSILFQQDVSSSTPVDVEP
jgi:hypothetical protein